MTIRQLMKQLVELDPETRICIRAHSGCCADPYVPRVDVRRVRRRRKGEHNTYHGEYVFDENGEMTVAVLD